MTIGLISAILIAKKHFRKNKPRLKRLQQHLQQSPLTRTTYYELSLKSIFCMLFLIALILFLNYFQENYLLELVALKSRPQAQTLQQLQELQSNYGNLCKVLTIIRYIYIFCIVIIGSQVKWKIVTVDPSKITIISYNTSKQFKQQKIINWSSAFILKIFKKGQQRFTNNTNYYSIELIKMQQQQCLHEEIIQRSNAYHAKKNAIEMGSILHFVPDLKIH